MTTKRSLQWCQITSLVLPFSVYLAVVRVQSEQVQLTEPPENYLFFFCC